MSIAFRRFWFWPLLRASTRASALAMAAVEVLTLSHSLLADMCASMAVLTCRFSTAVAMMTVTVNICAQIMSLMSPVVGLGA